MQTFTGRQAPILDRLKSIGQFGSSKKAELREVARLAEQVKVGEGEILIREGQYGKESFLILSGTAEVTQKGRPVTTLGPGDFFGELAMLGYGRRNATVTALCDLDLLVIGRRELNAMLDISEFRDALLKNMARRTNHRLATRGGARWPIPFGSESTCAGSERVCLCSLAGRCDLSITRRVTLRGRPPGHSGLALVCVASKKGPQATTDPTVSLVPGGGKQTAPASAGAVSCASVRVDQLMWHTGATRLAPAVGSAKSTACAHKAGRPRHKFTPWRGRFASAWNCPVRVVLQLKRTGQCGGLVPPMPTLGDGPPGLGGASGGLFV